nr:hypothetical protein GTC16762_14150 [Pigmentibacter ruber]
MKNTNTTFVLPSLSENIVSCLSAIYKNEISYDAITDKISKDLSMFKKVLDVANSQHYSKGVITDDLKQAIIRLGIVNLTVLLTSEYYSKFPKFEDIGFFSLKKFNLHSVCVSKFAFEIAKLLNLSTANDLMLAGAFHDVGLLIRAVMQREIMQDIVNCCIADKINFYTAETKLQVMTHDILGSDLLQSWGFNQNVLNIIRFHHAKEKLRPYRVDFLNKEINILELSDVLAHRFSCGFENYHTELKVHPMLIERLGLSKETVMQLVKKISKTVPLYMI